MKPDFPENPHDSCDRSDNALVVPSLFELDEENTRLSKENAALRRSNTICRFLVGCALAGVAVLESCRRIEDVQQATDVAMQHWYDSFDGEDDIGDLRAFEMARLNIPFPGEYVHEFPVNQQIIQQRWEEVLADRRRVFSDAVSWRDQ